MARDKTNTGANDASDPAQPWVAYAAAMATDAASVMHTYKSDKRSSVRLYEYNGTRFVAKIYHAQRWDKWAGLIARRSRASREIDGCAILKAIGLRANPVRYTFTHEGDSVLLFDFVDGPSLHHWLKADHAAQVRSRVLHAVGQQAALLIGAGYINRDYKPSNLLIDHACQRNDAQPMMIDTLAIQKCRSASQITAMLDTFKRAADEKDLISEPEWHQLRSTAMAGMD